MKEALLQYCLESAKYQFAKSMPYQPHWYTLRKNWNDDKLFEEVVQTIRDIGVERPFGKRTYIYYDYNGFMYWTMGDTLPNTILINRARLPVLPKEL